MPNLNATANSRQIYRQNQFTSKHYAPIVNNTVDKDTKNDKQGFAYVNDCNGIADRLLKKLLDDLGIKNLAI